MDITEMKLLLAAKEAHAMLMGFLLNPQQMEVVVKLNDAIAAVEDEPA